MSTRSLFVTAVLMLPLMACSSPAPAPVPAPAPEPAAIGRYELPASVSFPEGIAHDASSGVFYTGGAQDGTLVRVNAETGAVDVVAAAGVLVPTDNSTFPAVLGMELDDRKRLWIAGGSTGNIWVVNSSDGAVVKKVTVPTAGKSLINDVAIVGNAGYFTDTFVPTLWRLAATVNTIGNLEPWLDLNGTAIAYGEGANLNGITATPDGQTLIVVQMGMGLLFKIDVATKAVSAIDTAGADLSGADGLVLDGNTLYVVRQTAVEIATVQLSDNMTRGTVTARFKDPMLAWPATAVKTGDELVVVNTQFNTRSDNSTTRPFTLLRVPISRLTPR